MYSLKKHVIPLKLVVRDILFSEKNASNVQGRNTIPQTSKKVTEKVALYERGDTAVTAMKTDKEEAGLILFGSASL